MFSQLLTAEIIAVRIKKSRKTNQIKFKVRNHRHLSTLTLKDADKADKLKQSLPPGRSTAVKRRALEVYGRRIVTDY